MVNIGCDSVQLKVSKYHNVFQAEAKTPQYGRNNMTDPSQCSVSDHIVTVAQVLIRSNMQTHLTKVTASAQSSSKYRIYNVKPVGLKHCINANMQGRFCLFPFSSASSLIQSRPCFWDGYVGLPIHLSDDDLTTIYASEVAQHALVTIFQGTCSSAEIKYSYDGTE